MPILIEFSGPLVAPRTAVDPRQGARHAAEPAGRRRQPREGRAGARRDRPGRPAEPCPRPRGAASTRRRRNVIEAERQHDRNVGLASQNFISPSALQTSQARLDAARAQLKSAEAQLSTSRARRPRSRAGRADPGHRRPAPRRAGREGERRAAAADGGRPVDARGGRHRRHARGLAAAVRPAGRRAGRRAGRASCPAASTASRRPPKRARARSASSSCSTTATSASAPASTPRCAVRLADPQQRLTVPIDRRRAGVRPGLRVDARERDPRAPHRRDRPHATRPAGRVEVARGLKPDVQVRRRALRQPEGRRAGQGGRAALGADRVDPGFVGVEVVSRALSARRPLRS